ncbi:MAG: ABC transporter ATP-binding protein [Deltaproteobacteria bacterium]
MILSEATNRILEVDDLHTCYVSSHILFGVSLGVNKGEAVALVGRNGAGKSTTLKSVMGILKPLSGCIKFKNEDITGLSSYVIAQKGVGYVPEDRRVFAHLSVEENLKVAEKYQTERVWTMEKIFELFPHLGRLKRRKAGSLSGGEQQMLTVARTMMGNPELCLLDEPSEGLAPLIVQALCQQLCQIKSEGVSLVLSEQNMLLAKTICDRVYIIEKGTIPYHGTVQELQANKAIAKTYLAV